MIWADHSDSLTMPTPMRVFFVPMLAALSVIPLAVSCSGDGEGVGGAARNVILISIDTLRPDHLGCYGYGRDTSPTLDVIAEQGALFEQCSSSAPWTLPGHATMLTGLYPSTHGVKDHDRTLGDDTPSLATLLRESGLRTMAVVNSHNIADPRYGLGQGFDEFKYINELEEIPGKTNPQGDPAFGIANRGPGITRQGLRLIEQHKDQPFFLFLHYYDVHTDFTPAPKYKRMFVDPYDGRLTGNTQELVGYRVRGDEITEDDARYLRQMYDAEIRQLDDILAGLFAYLDDRGLSENTLVVITSDHGEEYGEHGGVLHGRSQYQELLAIPLILRGPGVPAGARFTEPVSLVDVVPTILKMVGVRTDNKFDGVDLTLAWLNPDELKKPRYLFGEADHNNWIDANGKRAKYADVAWMVRVKNDKLHYNEILNSYELYDLSEDPFEQVDLAASRPERLDLLRAALKAYIRNEGSGYRIEPPDEEEQKKLKQLGY